MLLARIYVIMKVERKIYQVWIIMLRRKTKNKDFYLHIQTPYQRNANKKAF